LRNSAVWWDVLHRLPNQAIEVITHGFVKQRLFRKPALKTRTLLPAVPSLATSRKSEIMGNDEILTDDYVAELLAKDANDSAIKYSSMGLDAFKQSKYVLLTQNMRNAILNLLECPRISLSQILVSYKTSSRIPTVTMQHYAPKKLQNPVPAWRV
jgi:hypothetical protein